MLAVPVDEGGKERRWMVALTSAVAFDMRAARRWGSGVRFASVMGFVSVSTGEGSAPGEGVHGTGT